MNTNTNSTVFLKDKKSYNKKKSYIRRLWGDVARDRYLYAMLIPVVAYYAIFKYAPMYGVTIAFKNFRFADGILGSSWVGFANFQRMLRSSEFLLILKNNLLLNLYTLVFQFPAPIILAILLNEIRNKYFKKTTQSLLYIPHFISWVALGSIIMGILSPSTGSINFLLVKLFKIEPIYFMTSTFWWPIVFVLSSIWKSAGWGTIIYLAAITGINPELYEAAHIDGAGRFKCILNITIPCIRGTIAVLLILNMGHFLELGFEHIYSLQNASVRSVADVIATYVYRVGLQGMQYSYTSAIGLFQSLVGLILVLLTNFIVKKMGEGGIW
ncbi:MAG: ABC transporter permease subunit [Firmicutes bacterium]|nr:ABC transporter permease subunit [Bacillota bacterium]